MQENLEVINGLVDTLYLAGKDLVRGRTPLDTVKVIIGDSKLLKSDRVGYVSYLSPKGHKWWFKTVTEPIQDDINSRENRKE